jgi:protein gp37
MMQKSNIEYLTHHWGFYTGCNHWKTGVCPVGEKCWAKSMAHRFGRSFEPTLHPEKLLEPLSLRKPARIGVCFTGDLMGSWIGPHQIIHNEDFNFSNKLEYVRNWSLDILIKEIINRCPQHQFFFLTKAPQNYQKWGTFPDNAWVGMTICNNNQRALSQEFARLEVNHKWISFEPLMERIDITPEGLSLAGISWVVIGGWSGGKGKQPEISWIKEIVEACDRVGVPVFLKDNLKPLIEAGGFSKAGFAATEWVMCKYPILRLELPAGVK